MRIASVLTLASALLALGACSDGGSPAVPAAGDEAPTISGISDQLVPANESITGIAISVADDVTPEGELSVTAESDTPALVTDDGLALEGGGGDRTLAVSPVAGQTGEATITVTVTDSIGQTAESSFQLTVTPQMVSLDSFVRETFAADENADPRSVNDKEFTNDATDFDDLAAQ